MEAWPEHLANTTTSNMAALDAKLQQLQTDSITFSKRRFSACISKEKKSRFYEDHRVQKWTLRGSTSPLAGSPRLVKDRASKISH